MEYKEIICDSIWEQTNKPEYQIGAFKFKSKHFELYILNGLNHNENGPAYISYLHYYKNQILREFYYLKGKFFKKEEWEKQIQTKLYW